MKTETKTEEDRHAEAAKEIMSMGENWGCNIVSRKDTARFTGGIYSPSHLSNCDALGTGPEGSFKVGRQTVYPVKNFCRWLIKRICV